MSNNFNFSERSIANLEGVHPDLVDLCKEALKISTVDFGIIEGKRTKERQAELYKAGATKTMNSRHLTGHAIDVMAYVGSKGSWDWPLYYSIAEAFKKASDELGIDIQWGGDWTTFKDGPHFELSWIQYPKV